MAETNKRPAATPTIWENRKCHIVKNSESWKMTLIKWRGPSALAKAKWSAFTGVTTEECRPPAEPGIRAKKHGRCQHQGSPCQSGWCMARRCNLGSSAESFIHCGLVCVFVSLSTVNQTMGGGGLKISQMEILSQNRLSLIYETKKKKKRSWKSPKTYTLHT